MVKRSAPSPPPAPVPPGPLGPHVPVPPWAKKKQKPTTSSQSGAPAPWDPESVEDGLKSKSWWDKGAKGRKKKLRATEYWVRKNQENFSNMSLCDFTKRAVPSEESPSYYFRNNARKFEVIRYFVFLFQMVLLFIRVWRPTRKQVRHYGMGVDTPARRALVMIHSGELPAESVSQLKSLKRHLYGRVARETENLKELTQIAEAEADSDMVMSITFRILDHIELVMLPAVLEGKFPKLNVNYDSLSQYEDCWEEPLEHSELMCCSVKLVSIALFHVCNYFLFRKRFLVAVVGSVIYSPCIRSGRR